MNIGLKGWSIIFFKAVVIAAAGAVILYFGFRIFSKGGSGAEIVSSGFFLFLFLYLFGMLCAHLLAGSSANVFTSFLLYPKRFLKSTPIILSHQQGLIAAGKFEEAELELMELRSQYPASPEIALMLADLHATGFKNPAAAAADCQYYFARRGSSPHPLDLGIVLRYADWQQELNDLGAARTRLTEELKSGFFSESEKRALRLRLESIRNKRTKK